METEQLQKRIELLENFMTSFVASDRYIAQKHLQFLDGKNIQTALGTGTKIGTAPTQKLSLWGVTPVVQHSSTGEVSGVSTGSGTTIFANTTIQGGGYPTGYTLSDIVKALKECGILLI